MKLLDRVTMAPKSDPETGGELGEEFRADPEPGIRANSGRKTTAKVAPAPVSKASVTKLSREVADNLCTLLELGAAMVSMSDDVCGPVLEQQARPTADAIASILARNPKLLAKFAQADFAILAIQIGALGKALKPLAETVYHHHIARDHEGNDDERVDLDRFHVPAYVGAATR